MAALPYMKFFPADYLADTTHLTAAEHGAYLLLLINYWQRGKPLPDDDDRLARTARMTPDEWDAARGTLTEFFVIENGEWVHERVERDLEAVRAKSEQASSAGRASAERRSNGRSSDVQRTYQRQSQRKANHTDTDTDTDTDTGIDISLAHPEPQKPSKAAHPDRFSEFWDVYPRRVGKGGAEKAFAKAVRATDADVIISGARRFAERRAGQDPQFTPHPATWLNNRRWEDDPAADTPPKQDDRHEQSPKPRGYAPAHSSSSNILAAAAGELRKRTDPGGWGRVLHDEPDDDGGETLDLVASGGSWGAR